MNTYQALFTIILYFFSTIEFPQEGKHIFLKYNIEANNWKMDDYRKVGTTVTYPELEYVQSWGGGKGGGNMNINMGGVFSGIMNGFVTTSDDSLQIVNITLIDVATEKYLYGSDQASHSVGFAWGLGFIGHYLAQGMEEGKLETPVGTQNIGQSTGVNLGLGASYMYNIEDRLVINSRVLYHATYNSSLSQKNGKTFHAKGIRWFSRVRYYLTDNWVATATLQVENHHHNPENISLAKLAGKMNFVRFAIGFGYRW